MKDTGRLILTLAVLFYVVFRVLQWNLRQPTTYELKKQLKPQIIINQTTQDTTYVYTIKK